MERERERKKERERGTIKRKDRNTERGSQKMAKEKGTNVKGVEGKNEYSSQCAGGRGR